MRGFARAKLVHVLVFLQCLGVLKMQQKWGDDRFLITQLMKDAGLNEAKMLFMRPRAVQLWECLQLSPEENIYYVQGLPGTGKSSVIWTWACWCASSEKDKVVWLHIGKLGPCTMAILDNKSAIFVVCGIDDFHENLLEECGKCIVIVDGITKRETANLMAKVLIWKSGSSDSKLVIVTSDSHLVSGEDSAGWAKFRMYSWTLEEYKEACQCDAFFDLIEANLHVEDGVSKKKDELIQEKFFLAGSCARWFFGLNIDATTKDINHHISHVSNYKNVLSGLQGQKCEQHIHHLCSSFESVEGRKGIVSKYAAKKMLLRCELELAKGLLRHYSVQKNPVFHGWVVELMFLVKLRFACREGKEITVFLNNRDKEFWPASNCCSLGDTSPNVNSWLIPTKWNQGGYDFAQIEGDLLRVVQVTHGKSHDMKLQYVCTLLTFIRDKGCVVKRLDIVILLPVNTQTEVEGIIREFKIGAVTGELNIKKNEHDFFTNKNKQETELLQKWETINIRVLGFILEDGW